MQASDIMYAPATILVHTLPRISCDQPYTMGNIIILERGAVLYYTGIIFSHGIKLKKHACKEASPYDQLYS